jgi:hypothetical protein
VTRNISYETGRVIRHLEAPVSYVIRWRLE